MRTSTSKPALLANRRSAVDGWRLSARVLCVEHQVAPVGAAFGSKFLFFVDPHGRALIPDRVVRGWLAEHAGLRLRGDRDEREHAVWLRLAERWAAAVNVSTRPAGIR